MHRAQELVALMLIGGVDPMLAGVTGQLTDAGAISGQHATLFGAQLASGLQSYIVLAVVGAVGYLAGALVGWSVGSVGGRALVERHGRWLHISPQTFGRTEDWFERFGLRAVFLGRITPVVRAFISIPAGIFSTPLAPYTRLTLLGSLVWCLAFAGIGWAVGGSRKHFHHSFRYADYAAVAVLLVLAAVAFLHHRRRAVAS